ncbi:DNA-binding response regulator [Flavobacterium sp. DGU11]|uniref:DNA-binding response regulator n=1 Tax=Flavobacterium arundinis TaxID=3139143 RepID=A0ABU9I177_9FLAO
MSFIAIIEDELLIARDIQDILEEEGHECMANLTDYESAINAIEMHPFDLVLVDIMLRSKDDGIRIGEYLHEKKTVPFIFITSLHDKETLFRLSKIHAFGYIVKPFKPVDIVTNVVLALNSFRHVNVNLTTTTAPEIADDVPFQIRKVINYIHDNIFEKIYLDDLAAQTRWKKNHFISMFTTTLQVTPHQYILQCKIQKAMALLSADDSIAAGAVAFDLGFKSYSSFSKLFKKVAGVTVEDYRKKEMLRRHLP